MHRDRHERSVARLVWDVKSARLRGPSFFCSRPLPAYLTTESHSANSGSFLDCALRLLLPRPVLCREAPARPQFTNLPLCRFTCCLPYGQIAAVAHNSYDECSPIPHVSVDIIC